MGELIIRNARQSDRQRLANLIHFEEYVHRHLDWKPALDWIGSPPYIIAERGDNLVAALACPADPPGISWLRLYAVAAGMHLDTTWQLLWDEVCQQLISIRPVQVFALALQDWFTALLRRRSFEHIQDVVVLVWDPDISGRIPTHQHVHIRPMAVEDLPVVYEVDKLAFGLEWQNSLAALDMALGQSVVASIAEVNNEVVGYQISTSSSIGGHLARLAVRPSSQGQGIGTALVCELLETFRERRINQVTVNTQMDNRASLAIYENIGFKVTGESYPVFRLAVLA